MIDSHLSYSETRAQVESSQTHDRGTATHEQLHARTTTQYNNAGGTHDSKGGREQ